MKERVYICHTYYHVLVAVLKELNRKKDELGHATLIISTMSNDFEDLKERAESCGLFEAVYEYEEKEDITSEVVMKYHKDRGNTFLNLLQRIKYTKLLGHLQDEYIPVNLKDYKDVYVFCDSDPIGYYLNVHKIPYHAVEDGLDCIAYYDTARYSNRGHFGLKAKMSKLGLIFIENGYGKYCVDMEVNDISAIKYPTPNMIQVPRKDLYRGLSDKDKELIVKLFIENADILLKEVKDSTNQKSVMVLSEPLCDMETRKRIFRDIIEEYGSDSLVYIKPHPRDLLDYKQEFPEAVVISGRFPMEVLNYIPGLRVDRLVSVFTQMESIEFAKEKILLGEDFMDKYEDPSIHRQNDVI